jgi:hypothetical protein
LQVAQLCSHLTYIHDFSIRSKRFWRCHSRR